MKAFPWLGDTRQPQKEPEGEDRENYESINSQATHVNHKGQLKYHRKSGSITIRVTKDTGYSILDTRFIFNDPAHDPIEP